MQPLTLCLYELSTTILYVIVQAGDYSAGSWGVREFFESKLNSHHALAQVTNYCCMIVVWWVARQTSMIGSSDPSQGFSG